jgi:hypothetical protein
MEDPHPGCHCCILLGFPREEPTSGLEIPESEADDVLSPSATNERAHKWDTVRLGRKSLPVLYVTDTCSQSMHMFDRTADVTGEAT